ncbi:MAG TPA: lysozyme inhibitor LprI family protein [Candidatus Acidoferrum sp.]
MLNPVRLSKVFLLFAILLSAKPNTKPAEQSNAQKNPCDWAKTQQEMNQCSAEQYRKVDAHLNDVYGKLVHLMEKDLSDDHQRNDLQQMKFDDMAIQKLKAAERAWIHYRDLHCDAARHQIGGGSMSPMVWADCMTNLTDRRIEELKDAYELGDRKLE